MVRAGREALTGGCRLDDTIAAASEIELRFHATRGAMSLGQSQGGLPPDALVEDEDAVLADARRVMATRRRGQPMSRTRDPFDPCLLPVLRTLLTRRSVSRGAIKLRLLTSG